MAHGNAAPQVQFKPLSRADGSAVYTDRICSILVGVNGPIEVQRRDELPEEAAIEVNVRPCSGVGGPRERWLEETVHSILRSILLVHLYPRTLLQVTLQLMNEPSSFETKAKIDISLIASLINAAFVGLVDAGLPLRTTAVAATVAIMPKGQLVREPSEKDLTSCQSVHTMAYDKDGALLLDQSLGTFDMATWDSVAATLQKLCMDTVRPDTDPDSSMDLDTAHSDQWLRRALQAKVEQANAWREAT